MTRRRRSPQDRLDRVPDKRSVTSVRPAADLERTRTQEEYARLIDSLGGIIWEADAQTFQFLFVSAHAEALLGYPRQQWLDEPDFWKRHTHPDDVQRCAAFCLDATLRGLDHTFDYRMIAADGRIVWLRDTVTVVSNREGPVALRGIMMDITEQKTAEDATLRMQRIYQMLLANTQDNIALLSDDFRTVFRAGPLATQLGYGDEKMLGRSNIDLIHPDDRARVVEASSKLVAGTASPPIRCRVRHKDGSWRVIETIASRFRDESGEQFLVLNTRDVTDVEGAREALRAVEERLDDQRRQATKMEALGQLASGVAHDFNNLLTVISGYSQTLAAALDPRDPRAQDVNEIQRAASRATVLTRQLLAFSRKQVLQPQLLDLNVVVTDMGAMIGRLIGENIGLDLDLSPAVAPVLADRGQLEQVLLNLAVNARDAMPFGGRLQMRTAITEVGAPSEARRLPAIAEPYVTLSVIDTGSGMPPDIQRRIFEPFFTTKEPGKGTGLGLSTVYGIVKQSRGHIFVDSKVGHGTTFSIYLPRAAAQSIEAPFQKTEEAPTGTETVLLVEDERAVRELTRSILARQKYRVLTAASGAEALDLCRDFPGPIHLLITDIVMAGMSGPDLAARIEAARPRTRVLYMSGYPGEAVPVRGLAEEGVAFLQKPFTAGVLARKVREVLDQVSQSAD